MARAGIETGQFDAAESALGVLQAPPTELVRLLRERRAAAEAERSEFAELRDQRDTVRGFRGRRLLLPFALLTGVIGPAVSGVLRMSGTLDPVGFPIKRAVLPLVVGLVLLGWLRWTQRPGLQQGFNRISLSVLGLIIFAVGLEFVLGGLMGHSVPQVIVYNMLLFALAETVIARLAAPEFGWAALSSAVLAVVAGRWPQYSEFCFAAANAVTISVLWTVWGRRERRASAQAEGAHSAQQGGA
jgi:hypothetical protein